MATNLRWWDDDHQETLEDFRDVVNMTPNELDNWLDTNESKSVGSKKNGNESVGHRSGRRIVTLLNKNRAEYTRADVEHMSKVVGFVKRHLAQRPSGSVKDSAWRYSLKNWGHDPM